MNQTALDTDTLPELDALQARVARHESDGHGVRVRWHSLGEGPPLVLLHGGHGSWLHWVRNMDALSRVRQVWVPDMPGFGESADLGGEPHAADRLDRLVGVLEDSLGGLLGREAEIDLAGFSFGGLAAGTLAARRGRIRKLALLGSAGHGGPRRVMTPMVNWRLDDPEQCRAALRHNLAAFMLHDPARIDAVALAVHESASRRTRFRSKALSQTASLPRTLADFDRPMLMVWGEHDVTAVPEEAAALLADGREERDWCVVPAAGHWVGFEQAERVNPLLVRWFAAD